MISLPVAKRVVCIGNSDGFLKRVDSLAPKRGGLAFGVINPDDFITSAPGDGIVSLGIRVSELAQREPSTVFVIDSKNVTAARLADLYTRLWNRTPEASNIISI